MPLDILLAVGFCRARSARRHARRSRAKHKTGAQRTNAARGTRASAGGKELGHRTRPRATLARAAPGGELAAGGGEGMNARDQTRRPNATKLNSSEPGNYNALPNYPNAAQPQTRTRPAKATDRAGGRIRSRRAWLRGSQHPPKRTGSASTEAHSATEATAGDHWHNVAASANGRTQRSGQTSRMPLCARRSVSVWDSGRAS